MSNVVAGGRGRLTDRFGSDRSGAILPIFALCATVALATAALAVDFGRWHSERTTLAQTADAAALFGAMALADALAAGQTGEAATRAQTAALDAVKAKLGDEATPKITVVTEAPGTIKVALRKQGERSLSAVILPQDATISVGSEASVGSAIDVCVIALEPSAGKGIEFDGEGTITAHNCAIWSNPTSTTSIDAEGSSSATATKFCAAGGVNTGNYTFNPQPEANCPPVQDPLAQWVPLAIGACDHTNAEYKNSLSYDLSPGVYCGGIEASSGARLVFKPGIYVMKDGPLKITGGASVEGQGVAFLLTGPGSGIDLGGSSVVRLSAPVDGLMAGLVFAAARNEPITASRIRGDAELFLEGTIYLPTHDLEFAGGPAATAPPASSVLIARTLRFVGTGAIELRSNSATASMPNHAGKALDRRNVRFIR
jgi:Flp pilus assembly protein TadG